MFCCLPSGCPVRGHEERLAGSGPARGGSRSRRTLPSHRPGKFIFITIWAIRLTSCFVYRTCSKSRLGAPSIGCGKISTGSSPRASDGPTRTTASYAKVRSGTARRRSHRNRRRGTEKRLRKFSASTDLENLAIRRCYIGDRRCTRTSRSGRRRTRACPSDPSRDTESLVNRVNTNC